VTLTAFAAERRRLPVDRYLYAYIEIFFSTLYHYQSVVLAIVFTVYCLGHSKNVYDDDHDDLLPAGRSAANRPAAASAADRWDRRTDGRTLDRYIDPALRTMKAASQHTQITELNSVNCGFAMRSPV